MARESTQLAVLGAGPGDYAAAFYAADLGMQVTLVDMEKNPGGVCLYRGCIPSKALLHVAKVIDESRHAGAWGVTFAEPKIDVDKLRAFKQGVVDKLPSGVGQVGRMRKVKFIQGRARLSGPESMMIAGGERGGPSASAGASADKSGPPEEVFDRVLVAVGRRPNSKIPGLDKTTVKVDAKGFIETDGQRRTAEPTLFAIGDVAGEPMLAHKASHEARVAVDAIQGHRASFEPLAIPAVVFTDPEIAWTGLTEAQAQAEGRDVEIAKFPWGALSRAITVDRPDGVTKLVLDRKTGRVLGVGIAGSGAGELIAEGTLAIEMGATADDMKLTIHPHPTLSESLMEAAEVFFGQSTHVYKPKRK